MRTVYIANDGREFYTIAECQHYEENLEKLKGTPFQQTVRAGEIISSHICGDDILYAFRIRNKEDLDKVNAWVSDMFHAKDPEFGEEAIGTIQLITTDEINYWTLGTPNELKNYYAKLIDSYFDELIEKGDVE